VYQDTVEVVRDLSTGVRSVLFARCQGGKDVDQAGDHRVGGDRSEDGRLAPRHGDTREAVTAERDRQGDVQENLVLRTSRPAVPHLLGGRATARGRPEGGLTVTLRLPGRNDPP